MVSIEKNGEIKKHIMRMLNTFDCDSVKLSGAVVCGVLTSNFEFASGARSRPWRDLGARIAQQ